MSRESVNQFASVFGIPLDLKNVKEKIIDVLRELDAIKFEAPKLIGSGSEGCVHRPPMLCKTKCTDERCVDGVSKYMSKVASEQEIKANKFLDKIDPNFSYHIRTPFACEPKTEYDCPYVEVDDPVLLIYDYAGETVRGLTDNFKKKLLLGYTGIIYAVYDMYINNFAHNDAHENNITVTDRGDYYEMKFIDYGESGTKEELYQKYLVNEDGLYSEFRSDMKVKPKTPNADNIILMTIAYTDVYLSLEEAKNISGFAVKRFTKEITTLISGIFEMHESLEKYLEYLKSVPSLKDILLGYMEALEEDYPDNKIVAKYRGMV